MKTSTQGKALIKSFEGLDLKARWDVTGYAIGYGQHTYSDGKTVQAGHRITKDFANTDFDKFIEKFEKNVDKLITSNVSEYQFSALVSYAYNRGLGAFQKSDLLKMVNKNPNDSRIKEQFVIEWGTSQTYKKTLLKRRQAEAEFYSKGTFTNPQTTNYILYGALFLVLATFLYNPAYWLSQFQVILRNIKVLFTRKRFA